MTDKDLNKIEISRHRAKHYSQDGYDFVKRFVLKDKNNTPVSFIDLKEDGYGGLYTVVGTKGGRSYRHKGYASEATEVAMKWVEQNGQYMETPYKYVAWDAHSNNTGSRRLAEKSGFEFVYDNGREAEYRKSLNGRSRN